MKPVGITDYTLVSALGSGRDATIAALREMPVVRGVTSVLRVEGLS